jgi:hypothetical protein
MRLLLHAYAEEEANGSGILIRLSNSITFAPVPSTFQQ